ncbi:MAG: SufD family Fe-S cluster assembly protein [Candidatus Actinomarinaceae bacterium]
MNNKLFEKKLKPLSSKEFANITAKDEDWKYLGKKLFELNDIEIGKATDINSSKTFDIDSNCFTYEINSEHNHIEIIDINEIKKPLIKESIKRPFDKFNIEQFEKVTGGFQLNVKEDNEQYFSVNFQSDDNAIPYIGVSVEKNKSGKLYLNFDELVIGNIYPIIEIFLNDNSNLEIILSVTSTKEINIVNSIYAQLERDSNLTIHNISTGAGLSRSRMDIDLLGNGSEFSLDGIYFGEEKQIHDNRVFVNHLGKNTSSNMITKGVLGDESSSIFTGTIHIAEGAEKTESHQENRNILLSEEATAQSVPNLEILCDDVICSHGSSVGPIEENVYHYVMARGIEKVDADKLLIKGFFNEVINDSKWEIIHDKVSDIIEKKYMNIIESN